MSIDRSTIALGAHGVAWGTLLATTYLVRTGGLGTGIVSGVGAVFGFAVFATLAGWSGAQLVDRIGRTGGDERPCAHRPSVATGALPLATASQLEASRVLGYFGATTIIRSGSSGGHVTVTGQCSHRARGLTIRRVGGTGARGRCARV